MDIRDFSNKLAEATQNMSPEERESLMKMFQSVAGDIANIPTSSVSDEPIFINSSSYYASRC